VKELLQSKVVQVECLNKCDYRFHRNTVSGIQVAVCYVQVPSSVQTVFVSMPFGLRPAHVALIYIVFGLVLFITVSHVCRVICPYTFTVII